MAGRWPRDTAVPLAGRLVPEGLHAQASPGFLGSPSRSRPVRRIYGWPARVPTTPSSATRSRTRFPGRTLFLVSTSVFNLQTLGGEPARLGTEVVPGVPPGPLPNTVTLRTAPDPVSWTNRTSRAPTLRGRRGRLRDHSYQINIPKELGGSLEKVRAIDIVLCAYTPCRETLRNVAQSVVPLPDDPATPVVEPQPFFVNPTSCETDKVRLEARSYSPRASCSRSRSRAPPAAPTRSRSGVRRRPRSPSTRWTRPSSRAPGALVDRPGNVVVTGTAASTARFAGALRGVRIEQLTASEAGLTPSGTVTRDHTRREGRVLRGLPGDGSAGHRLDSGPLDPDRRRLTQAAIRTPTSRFRRDAAGRVIRGWNRGSCTYAQFGLDPQPANS